MPLYEYICGTCEGRFEEVKKIDERHTALCKCGGEGKIAIPRGKAPGLSIFRADFYEHLQPEPIWCNTAQDLRDACDRLGKVSPYLEDGVWKTSPGPDYDASADPSSSSYGQDVRGQDRGD